ncbi:MAG: hypothetical protein BJ554DRAFT_7260, partial [Olpidium bornovanus]
MPTAAMGVACKATAVQTAAFADQKPGTSGLRKKTSVFAAPHYTANFIQATLDSIPAPGKHGAVLVVGGDGRYYSRDAVRIIVRLAAQLKVSSRQTGPDNDFGIKYNVSNGGNEFGDGDKTVVALTVFFLERQRAARLPVTEKIFANTKALKEYYESDIPDVDLSTIGTKTFGDFSIDVVDSVADYVALMKEIFDFPKIKKFFAENKNF